MTLSELKASIAVKWGLGEDYPTLRRIELAIIGARGTTIQRRYDQSKRFPQSLVMTVRCTEFIQVEKTECLCLIAGKKTVRTKYKVPKPLLVKDNTEFIFVGSANQEEAFSMILPEDLELTKYRKFSANMPLYTYMNEYIYLPNEPTFKEGAMRYVPENPLELMKFGNCNQHSCIVDGDLVIEDSLIDNIESLVEKKRPQIVDNKEIEIND